MLVVFVDVKSDAFTHSFGAESYGEVMLFNSNFYGFMKSSVYPLIDDEYVVFSDNTGFYNGGETVFSDIKSLIDYINDKKFQTIGFFFLNTVISVDYDTFILSLNIQKCFSITDENGNSFGLVADKNDVEKILSEHSMITDIMLKNQNNLPSVYCVEKGVKVNNIKDYKMLTRMIFQSDFCDNLPEVAQGIYSLGEIPSGDYTIIPPVYFGEDIQIESGSVIGPFSVIYDSSLISRNTIIENSVILSNCYISKDCFLKDCICCSNVSVRRASSIFSGAVIGENSMLSEASIIDRNVYMCELILKNNEPLSRFVTDSENIIQDEQEDGTIEIRNVEFNIKYRERQRDNIKVLLKASSFEVAEEILDDIKNYLV